MKKLFFSSMLLGGLMMASCSEDVMEAPEVEKVEKSYAQQFVEKFGTISPDQDWNLAEKKSITINGASRAAGDGDVKIYAKYQGVFRLVAHYENIPAGEIEFDAPEFRNDIRNERFGLHRFIIDLGFRISSAAGKKTDCHQYTDQDL